MPTMDDREQQLAELREQLLGLEKLRSILGDALVDQKTQPSWELDCAPGSIPAAAPTSAAPLPAWRR
ncbi:MAG: hypothetical protein M0C28_25015 [Candidatus Moduliflexus flocculans]|nr:hypothetical protein [Candidatus Moduliflexus flocculans]